MASGTRSSVAAQACLLRLPDHCLLAVMQCCAADANVISAGDALSAAKAHSRLHQAAVEALSSINDDEAQQKHLDSLLLYLAKHGQHVHSMALCGFYTTKLLELPSSLTKLDSLRLSSLSLQLQPGGDAQGVLRAGFPLTRLELSKCRLLDGGQGLAAALMQLPDLQHLVLAGGNYLPTDQPPDFATDVLSHLTKLTCLRVEGVGYKNRTSNIRSADAEPLQVLTRLADLELGWYDGGNHSCCLGVDTLSGMSLLTRLVLKGELFEPRALAGKTQLQHLALQSCRYPVGGGGGGLLIPPAGVERLLAELQRPHAADAPGLDKQLHGVQRRGR